MTFRPTPSLVLLSVLALGGCKDGPTGQAGAAAGRAASRGGSATDRPPDSALPASSLGREREDRWFRIDALMTNWDAVQQEGRDQEAGVLAAKLREEVDADYDELAAAARGAHGVRAEHLGVKALAFSGRPAATDVLVNALRTRDASLLGNALIALKVRADPATSLPPLVALLRDGTAEARRYAPLAFANVALARERAGRPVEEATVDQAMTGLLGLVQDRDPYARLHAAKAMGALRRPESTDFLVLLLRDDHVRIRLAAAAALERIGDPRAFPQVVRLLESVPEESKSVVRDVLASYAERIQRGPLPAGKAQELGTSAIAWDRWYSDHVAGRSTTGGASPR